MNDDNIVTLLFIALLITIIGVGLPKLIENNRNIDLCESKGYEISSTSQKIEDLPKYEDGYFGCCNRMYTSEHEFIGYDCITVDDKNE